MGKHTKGPWKADVRTGTILIVPQDDSRNCACDGSEPIARISGNGKESEPYGYRYVTGEQIANATMMAAAPDLLEALKAQEELHDVGLFESAPGQIERTNRMRRAAIAKAEGR